ncbi:MAG: thioredoxin domain-containing protein, partial [Polyangiaceae bacterium]
GDREDPRTRALAREAYRAYLPNRTIAWLSPDDPESRSACAVLAEGKAAKEVPVAYVCKGRTCSLPVSEPAELAALLGRC